MSRLLPPPPQQDNAISTTWALLKAMSLHDKITRGTLEEALLAHPEYPSLQSVSDVLTRFKIENASFKLSLSQLQELPSPLLVHLRTKGGLFAVVTQQSIDAITYTDGFRSTTESAADFSKKWTGVTLLAEAIEATGEPNYTEKRKQERWEHLRIPTLIVLTSLLLLCIAVFSVTTFSWIINVLWSLKLIGAIVCSLLLSVHIEGKQSFASSLCQLSDRTDCNSILTSPAAMIGGLVSWAEIGFLYYTGSFLTLVLGMVTHQLEAVLWPLALMSWLAVPYTIFSIYYQAQVAKQWCTLCLVIQGLFIVEVVLYGYSTPLALPAPVSSIFIIIGFGLPLGVWLLLKPLWQDSLQLRKTKRELSKFKNNPDLFEQLLNQQPAIPPLTTDVQAIRLGSVEAAHTLVIVTNPYCGPCARAHQKAEELLALYPDLGIYLLVTTCNSERNQQVAAHWLALQAAGYDLTQALHSWYAQPQKDYETWAKQFPVASTVGYKPLLEAHCEWTQYAGIKGTPTFYFDGHLLPNQYRLEELSTLLMALPLDFAKSI